MWPKVLPHVKKIPILSTKTVFFQIIIVKSFLDRFFNKFHTKTFRMVYILIVYLLIMFIRVVFICTITLVKRSPEL